MYKFYRNQRGTEGNGKGREGIGGRERDGEKEEYSKGKGKEGE